MGNPLPPPTVLTALAIGPNLGDSVRVIPPSDSPIAGTTYTLVLDDDGLWKRTTNSSAVTVTVPPHSAVPIPLNSSILISQGGAGAVTIAAGAGVTLNASGGTLATTSEFEVIRLFQNTLDNWTLTITGTGGSSGGSLSITDGTHTVAGTTGLTVTGATVGGTSPNATLLVEGLPTGGTTNQVLAKASNTNFDTAWVDTGGGGGSPAGPQGAIQFNNAGAFGGANIILAGDMPVTLTAAPGEGLEIHAGVDTGSGGGAIELYGGDDAGAGAGAANLYGGNDNGGGAGSANVNGGFSQTTGVKAGSATINGGTALIGNADGGDVQINGGGGAGTGKKGDVFLFGLPTVDPTRSGTVWNKSNVLVLSGYTGFSANTVLGPGTTVLNFTATFGAVAALTGTAVTQAVTGLLTTDQCHVECVSAPPSGYNHPNARCSTNGTLELYFTTAVALGITLGALNYRLTVIR